MLELMNQVILEVNARRRVEVIEETMRASRSQSRAGSAPARAEQGQARFVTGTRAVTASPTLCSEA